MAQGHPDLRWLSSCSLPPSPSPCLCAFFFFCDVIFSLSSHSLLFPEAVWGMNASLFLSLHCFPKLPDWMRMSSTNTLSDLWGTSGWGGGNVTWCNYMLHETCQEKVPTVPFPIDHNLYDQQNILFKRYKYTLVWRRIVFDKCQAPNHLPSRCRMLSTAV